MFSTKSIGTRSLCWFLALLTLVTPNSQLIAQEAPPIDTTYLLPQACVVVSLRPQAMFNSKVFKMMPLEVLQAASVQYTGIDALQMDQLLVSVEPPGAGPPNYTVTLGFTAPVAGKLHPEITKSLEQQADSERPHFKNPKPLEPSLYFPSDNMILATPEATLQKFLAGGLKATESSLREKLLTAADDDLYVAVDFVPLRPLVNMSLMQQPIPQELQHLYMAPDLVKAVELRLNLSHPGTNELVVEANNAEDAEKLEQLVIKTSDLMIAQVAQQIAQLKSDPDPVQQAMGRYQERMILESKSALMPQRDGSRLFIFRQTADQQEGEMGTLTATAVTGILVALLLPAVQAAREAARRIASINNMKRIMLALLNYESATKAFPAHASYKDDKPLLSWRVHILPYLEQQELYNQFRLDEPWNSEHNKTLIAKMPELYLDPSSRWQPTEGRTHYLGVKGEGSFLNGTDKGIKMKQITDGTSNTIAIVQVNDDRAITWTKPDDWEFDAKNPMKGLAGSMHPGTSHAGLADGYIHAISKDIDPDVFKKLLTIAGGEEVEVP